MKAFSAITYQSSWSHNLSSRIWTMVSAVRSSVDSPSIAVVDPGTLKMIVLIDREQESSRGYHYQRAVRTITFG